MIRVENLTKRFGGFYAVNGASLTIETGSITGLIGPNGAGKSTLVNLLSRQYDADAGKATFANADLTRIAREAVSRFGVSRSFQNLRFSARSDWYSSTARSPSRSTIGRSPDSDRPVCE